MDLRIFVEPQQGASHATLLAVAHATADAGFSAFFRSDHLLVIGSSDGQPGPSDSWVSLAAIAARVPDIRLGTLVTSATFRHPSMLAIAVANVDDISGGRVELGIGTGWYEAEHRAYGIDYYSGFGERFDRLEEQLEIITGLWRTPAGQTFDYTGKFFRLEGSPGLPKPVQSDAAGRPSVPIIIGGRGPKRTPALVARYGSEINIGYSPLPVILDYYATVRAAAEAVGRDPGELSYSTMQTLCLGRTRAELERRAAAIGRDPEDLVENTMSGSPAQVAEKLAHWAESGVERVYLEVLDLSDLDHIALAGAELIPAVRSL